MGHPMASVHHFWVQAGVWSIVALISGEILRTFSFFFHYFLPNFPIFAIFAHFAHFAHPYRPLHGLGSSCLGTSRCVKYSCIDFRWDIKKIFIFFHYFLPNFWRLSDATMDKNWKFLPGDNSKSFWFMNLSIDWQLSRVPLGRFWSIFDVEISTSNFLTAGEIPIFLSCHRKKWQLCKDNYSKSVFTTTHGFCVKT